LFVTAGGIHEILVFIQSKGNWIQSINIDHSPTLTGFGNTIAVSPYVLIVGTLQTSDNIGEVVVYEYSLQSNGKIEWILRDFIIGVQHAQYSSDLLFYQQAKKYLNTILEPLSIPRFKIGDGLLDSYFEIIGDGNEIDVSPSSTCESTKKLHHLQFDLGFQTAQWISNNQSTFNLEINS
jgi:hypothetical protein